MRDLTQFYDKIYKEDPDYNGGSERTLEEGKIRFNKIKNIIFDNLPKENFKEWRVLDIGCSTGKMMEFFAPQFKEFAGVDISKTAVEKAKEKGFKEAYAVDAERQQLPFGEKSFNMVFALEIIEHLFGGENFFMEIKRVLKPGGYLFITTPNDVLNWKRRIKILFGGIPFEEKLPLTGNHIRFFSKKSLRNTLLNHNFNVIKIGGIPLSYRKISLGLPGKILSAISPDIFSGDYFVIGQI